MYTSSHNMGCLFSTAWLRCGVSPRSDIKDSGDSRVLMMNNSTVTEIMGRQTELAYYTFRSKTVWSEIL